MSTSSAFSSNLVSSFEESPLVSREVTHLGEDDSTSHTDLFYVEGDSWKLVQKLSQGPI